MTVTEMHVSHPETNDPVMRTTSTPTRAATPRDGGRLSELGQLLQAQPPLSDEDERRLARAARQGDAAARTTLIQANIRLALSIAGDYLSHAPDLDDLVSEGLVGLTIAADRYDPDHTTDAFNQQARFSTYAAYWIRQRVRRFACENGLVHVPAYVAHHLYRIRRAQADARRGGHMLGLEQAAQAIGLTPSQIATVLAAIPAQAARAALGTSSLATSREAGDHDARDAAVTNMPSRERDPQEATELHDQVDLLRKALRTIPDRSRTVLIARYGLDGQPAQSLEAISQTLGMSRQRVGQIYCKALRQLRARLGPIGNALFDPDRPPTRRH